MSHQLYQKSVKRFHINTFTATNCIKSNEYLCTQHSDAMQMNKINFHWN